MSQDSCETQQGDDAPLASSAAVYELEYELDGQDLAACEAYWWANSRFVAFLIYP